MLDHEVVLTTKPKETKGKSKDGGVSKQETKDLSSFKDSTYESAKEAHDEQKGGSVKDLFKVSWPS